MASRRLASKTLLQTLSLLLLYGRLREELVVPPGVRWVIFRREQSPSHVWVSAEIIDAGLLPYVKRFVFRPRDAEGMLSLAETGDWEPHLRAVVNAVHKEIGNARRRRTWHVRSIKRARSESEEVY